MDSFKYSKSDNPNGCYRKEEEDEDSNEMSQNITICKKSSYQSEELIKKKKEKKGVEQIIPLDKNKNISLQHLEEPGKNKGNFVKTNKNVIIGRSNINDMKFPDPEFLKIDVPECSRLHALIYKTDKGFFISDNNTRNGTFLKVPLEGIVFKNDDQLIFEIGTYLYTFKQKKKKGSKYLKVGLYLYLNEFYQGKKFKKESFRISFNNTCSTIKLGSNPKTSSTETEEVVDVFEIPLKDKKLKANHFFLKKTKDSESIQLIPNDFLSEVWAVVKNEKEGEVIRLKEENIIKCAAAIINVKTSLFVPLTKDFCACEDEEPKIFDGFLINCGHFYCSECCKNKANCPQCKTPILEYKKIFDYF